MSEGVIRSIANYLADILFPSGRGLMDKAKLSPDEVSMIAADLGRTIGWLPEFPQQRPYLKTLGKRLIWAINFGPEPEDGVVMIGHHRYITVDDETRVAESFAGPR